MYIDINIKYFRYIDINGLILSGWPDCLDGADEADLTVDGKVVVTHNDNSNQL